MGRAGPWLPSDLAEAEFAAAVARKRRTGAVGHDEAAFLAFGVLAKTQMTRVRIAPEDLAQATAWIRRLDLNLRAPDAIHIAAAQRLGAALVTFDAGTAAASRSLGVTVAPA